MLAGVRSSLALIRYKQNGQETQYGLRLDLDKRVFLDRSFLAPSDNAIESDAIEEALLQQAAPKIVSVMAKELRTAREHAYTLAEG